MTLQIGLTSMGELDIAGGTLHLIDNVAQRVRTRLLMLLGEWFLAVDDGTPYLQLILIKNVNLDHVRSALRARILETEGVTGIVSLVLDFDSAVRRLRITLEGIGPSGLFGVAV